MRAYYRHVIPLIDGLETQSIIETQSHSPCITPKHVLLHLTYSAQGLLDQSTPGTGAPELRMSSHCPQSVLTNLRQFWRVHLKQRTNANDLTIQNSTQMNCIRTMVYINRAICHCRAMWPKDQMPQQTRFLRLNLFNCHHLDQSNCPCFFFLA